jgi:DNA-binding transcriptional LysR family regulator
MEWNDVEIFLAIARHGTLGAAARALGLTQPTMGRRLKVLEASLGQTLFQRTADGFVLTDEGTAALGPAERMEEEALGLRRALSGQETQLTGVLRVSSSDWFGTHLLAPVIAEFTRENPRIIVELVTESRILNLARREADLAFRITPFKEPDVISRKLLHIPYGAYQRKGTKPPGDGAGSRLITMDEAFGGMPDVAWLRRTFPQAETGTRSNNRDAQARLCIEGAGIAVLPKPLAKAYPELQEIRVAERPPPRATARCLRSIASIATMVVELPHEGTDLADQDARARHAVLRFDGVE